MMHERLKSATGPIDDAQTRYDSHDTCRAQALFARSPHRQTDQIRPAAKPTYARSFRAYPKT